MSDLEPEKVFAIGEAIIVVVHSDDNEALASLAGLLREEAGDKVTVIGLTGRADLEMLNEDEMRQLGWVRTSPAPPPAEVGITDAELDRLAEPEQ